MKGLVRRRGGNRASPYFLQITEFCFSKSQRENLRWIAQAFANFANGLIHFQKNDFWLRFGGGKNHFFETREWELNQFYITTKNFLPELIIF